MKPARAQTAPDTNGQYTLPGCEGFAAAPKPALSHKARRVLDLLQWYSKAAWGYCGAFQRTLAAKLGRSVRWLASALAELRALGVLEVRHRGPHAAEYLLKTERLAELFAELSPPSSITESNEKTAGLSTPGPVEIPPAQIPNEYGRLVDNPVWFSIKRVMRAAAHRIGRARNPQAYHDAILRVELAKWA